MRCPLPLAPRPRSGVTLIEVVIAIFVLSIGILGIMSLFPAGYSLTRKSVDRTVGALAARHAIARLAARVTKIDVPKPQDEDLSSVSENGRVGTIAGIPVQNQLDCIGADRKVHSWGTDKLTNYYIVMTSGTAEGRVYKINSNTATTLTCDTTFNLPGIRDKEPVRVGDHFSIIGSKSAGATKCFPANFLTNATTGTQESEWHTTPVATYGNPSLPRDQWRYSYGCILTAPSPEMQRTLRIDIFIYCGYPYRGDVGAARANSLLIGHYVAYLAGGQAKLQGN